MTTGAVIAFVVDPKTGNIIEQPSSFYSVSNNPADRARDVEAQFKNGMKGWGKERKAFGEGVLKRGLTLQFVPVSLTKTYSATVV